MPRVAITLPDFIIIGANKAGTSSMAAYLTQHPEVGFSYVKEPMFFSKRQRAASPDGNAASLDRPFFTSTLQEYSAMFDRSPPTARVFGEASTSYMATPFDTAGLMSQLTPDVKIIAVLRDPVDRAVSGYKMCTGDKIEDRDFAEVVKEASTIKDVYGAHNVKEYFRLGLYSRLLAPFMSLFPSDHFLFINYDDFDKEPGVIMDKVCDFIGIERFAFNVSKRHNTSSDHGAEKIQVTSEQRAELRLLFRNDIIETQKITGLDLSSWLKSDADV